MKLTIEINLDNAAFADAFESELERALLEVSNHISPLFRGRHIIRDINGNAVGFAKIED